MQNTQDGRITRRHLLTGAGALAAVGLTGAPALAALPAANMEAVVKAAQIDPQRAGTALTPGARDSVLLVERALVAKGLLASSYVDGHFGSKTVEAYAAWQRRLGYSGLGANGLPGRTSLTRLGEGRFTVSRAIGPGSRITFRGRAMNERTKAMLLEAERLAGRTYGVTQGSYNPGGVGASAGTHDGGGALDLSVSGLTTTQRTTAVRSLRRVGFAAWYRSPSEGPWNAHIHAIAISDTDLSSGAQSQVGDYYLGRNGLANHGADTGPQVTRVTWEEYRRA